MSNKAEEWFVYRRSIAHSEWVSLNMLQKEFFFPELFRISSYLFSILYLCTLLSLFWVVLCSRLTEFHFLEFIWFLQSIKITLNSSPLFSNMSSVSTWVSAVHMNLCFISSFKLLMKVLTRTGFRTNFQLRQWTSAN